MPLQSAKTLLLRGMRQFKTIYGLFCWLGIGLVLWILSGTYGCANIGQPTGGVKDSLPPVLVKMSPENYTNNFNSKTIILNFDEFVDIENPFEKLIINPPFERFPIVEKKLRTVTIKLKDTLEANTTYSMRFDNVVKDVNEGNPLENFTYVFSSGSSFDSATLTGRVLDAETGKVDSTLLVVLHSNLSDTAITKIKPRYITKMDGKGFFRFTYLAPGLYQVFVLKDDGIKRYSDTTEPFAFLNEPILISEKTEPIEMLFFKAAEKKPEPTAQDSDKPKNKDENEKKTKRLTVSLAPGNHDILEDLILNFSAPLQTLDSSKISLTDTLMKPVGTYSFIRDSIQKNRILFRHGWKMGAEYRLVFFKGAATDSSGVGFTKNDTLTFSTKTERDYGSLKITFLGLDMTQNPVIQYLLDGKIVKRTPLTGNIINEKIFKPGEYEINILLDGNKNGKWDTGNYRSRKQPERVLQIPKKINVRGNWENEFTIDINAAEEKE